MFTQVNGKVRSWDRTSDAFGYHSEAWGYRWRSSRAFVISVVCFAMFADAFLFSFIVPILSDQLENRIHLPSEQTQRITSLVLSMNAFVSILIAPIVGSIADRVAFRNGLMVLSWMINVVGTAITAWSTTLAGLFLGRLIQTFAGSAIFIVGMAMISDAAGPKNLSKTLSLMMMFVSAGLLSGPAVSGALYELSGYLATWMSAFVVLIIGTILQVTMMEKPGEIRKVPVQWTHSDTATERDEEASVASTAPISDVEYEETSALLQDPNATAPVPGHRSISNSDENLPVRDQRNDIQETSQNVYWLMLRRLPVTTALVADVLFAIIIASFEATLPIHIKDVFGWKTLQAGLLFLLIQFPSLVLLAPAGWLKDKIGMRMPVTIGFLLFAPSLWLLGVPGSGGFEWANHGNIGQIIFMGSLLSIGVWRVLLLGFGAVEVMNGANQLEAEHPGVFGPNGGNSRAFSMTNISWKSGMLLGPLISGALTESVGYYYMNLIFGILCFLMGISVFLVLRKR